MVTVELNNELHYVPILKGRQGELTALSNVDPDSWFKFTPLLEVVPSGLEYDEDGEVNVLEVGRSLNNFVKRFKSKWSADRPVIVDAGLLPSNGEFPSPMTRLVTLFGEAGYTMRPTVRPSDPDGVIVAVREASNEWGLTDGACIRVGGEDLDDSEGPLDETIDHVLGLLNLQPHQVDMIVDFGAVQDERAVGFAARVARLVLSELPHQERWRTLAIAAGAFPPDLSSVPPDVLTELPRNDASMWRAIRDRARGRVPSFADYAIANPEYSVSTGFAPAPQLRYTTVDHWLIMKGRRKDRRGSAQFFDICQRLVDHPSFTPSLSWGDRRIAHAAMQAGIEPTPAGAGNAMMWRAIATSHHISFITHRLANEGAP